MAIRIVRLGAPRQVGEGLRIGTVRHLPRGVPKAQYAERDYFDTWLPSLSPSPELVAWAREEALVGPRLAEFRRRVRAELGKPEPRHVLELLAALSHRTDFSVGCYCENETQCHRSVLRELLTELGAAMSEG